MTTDTRIEKATIDATIAAMGWQSKRVGDSEFVYMDELDNCGVCGERDTRWYNVALGVPQCGPCRGAGRS